MRTIPTFSIIIPAYNSERYIERSLMSVLSQTFHDFEIIVVNDGSVDSTATLLGEWAKRDLRIRVIHQPNHGPLIARQTGICHASGRYFLFLDADDHYEKSLLETVYKYFLAGYDMILFRWHFWQDTHYRRESQTTFAHEKVFTQSNKQELYAKFIETAHLNTIWSNAYKRSLFSLQEMDQQTFRGIKNGEDLIQVLSLVLHAENIIYLDMPLYNYVINETSTTCNFNPTFFQSRKLVYLELENFLIQTGLNSPVNRAIIERRFLANVSYCIIPPVQMQKAGQAFMIEYLGNIAEDELFRRIYATRGTQGMEIFARAMLHILYHRRFRGVVKIALNLAWLEKSVIFILHRLTALRSAMCKRTTRQSFPA